MAFTFAAAEETGIPVTSFFPIVASGLMGYVQYPTLVEKELVSSCPLKGEKSCELQSFWVLWLFLLPVCHFTASLNVRKSKCSTTNQLEGSLHIAVGIHPQVYLQEFLCSVGHSLQNNTQISGVLAINGASGWRLVMTLVKREEVQSLVKELMEGKKGKEMKNKSTEWKTLAEDATAPHGSSSSNLDNLVNQLRVCEHRRCYKISTIYL
ncbi:putative cyanohydrin beta-glucosyltransferase [Rosa chinensis]|uniref:Putative cyanohydrin beta-glucosyltransferase n=1 Tax=Rosa chinensis TaxID=74649 RepID=A0A2P6S0U6_ROSCH|nr:putative cyanohydrin beta-glucosyltransferase [Rosa chinensis]